MTMNKIALKENEISVASTEQLKLALTQGLTISAKQLNYLSLIWMELEKRGEDLSALRSGLAVYLPLIASNKLDAEVVVRFAGQRTLLSKLMELTVEQQREMLSTDTIDVVDIGNDGKHQVTKKTLMQLSAQEAIRVFSNGQILTPEEQKKKISKSAKPVRQRISSAVHIEIKGADKLLSVGGKRVKIERVFSALEEHYGATGIQQFLKGEIK